MQTVKPKMNVADIFFQLTRRHLLVLFRNKMRVFFTVMAPIIIFAIYVLFLRRMELGTVEATIMQLNTEKGFALNYGELSKSVECIVDSWMFSGIIAISSLTVSLQTNNIIVSDKENGVNRDFASSPVNKGILIASYFFYSFIVTVLISLIFLIFSFIYLACLGEFTLNAVDIVEIIGIVFFSSISSVLFTVFICSFVTRDATMGSIITIFSTAVGFLIGAYMPIAMLPSWVGDICGFFPGTYTCSLLRYSFLDTPLHDMFAQLSATSGGTELVSELYKNFGFNLKFFGMDVEPTMQAVALAIFSAVLAVMNIFSARHLVKVVGAFRKKKKSRG